MLSVKLYSHYNLNEAGKSIEVQVNPDLGYTAVSTEMMMEFFIQKLLLEK